MGKVKHVLVIPAALAVLVALYLGFRIAASVMQRTRIISKQPPMLRGVAHPRSSFIPPLHRGGRGYSSNGSQFGRGRRRVRGRARRAEG